MLPSDKELIEGLLQACESLYVQNILLRGLLRTSGLGDWKSKLDSVRHSSAASLARADFQQRYAQAVKSVQQMRNFVKDVSPSEWN